MTLLRNAFQKVSFFGLAACAGLGLLQGSAQAQGFSPVDPQPILSGSAGFTDLFVFASAAREDDDKSVSFNDRTVTSNIDAAPIFNQLVTTNGSAVTTLDFETGPGDFTPLSIDALGRIDGIATVSNGGEVREIPISGRAVFREFVTRRYAAGAPSDGSVKGGPIGVFNQYGTSSLSRNIDHRLFFRGVRTGFGVQVNLASRAFLSSPSGAIKTSYEPSPTSMNGTLMTIDGFGRRAGVSVVNVTGLFDTRATFDTTGSSLTSNTSLTNWNGDAVLFSPFNPTPVPGGVSRFQFRPYDTARNLAGRYKIEQTSSAVLNVPLTPANRVASAGFFLNTASELTSVSTGAGALSDLQYRDANFNFASPSALTSIRSVYDTPTSTLVRNSNANVFE